ncbi:transposase [Bacillaceae bacterium IKA-2]|nr:transposase [Bacillaceae bacterium IKA-2]WNF37208.1 transposase [Bacillaceae bacterium IKA-2]WNF37853.1 transposase [Bacillaceae bacterium IKA-2]WNF38486.1 transposase [Bacillaceae bacterium IKA-2]
MGNRGKSYSAEFKQDAVNHYYSSDKSIEQVAKDLKIGHSTLSKWVKAAKENDGVVNHRGSGNFNSDSEKEVARLKKELKDSKDALEILKKAIGILNN